MHWVCRLTSWSPWVSDTIASPRQHWSIKWSRVSCWPTRPTTPTRSGTCWPPLAVTPWSRRRAAGTCRFRTTRSATRSGQQWSARSTSSSRRAVSPRDMRKRCGTTRPSSSCAASSAGWEYSHGLVLRASATEHLLTIQEHCLPCVLSMHLRWGDR